jgi:hypothetical protein
MKRMRWLAWLANVLLVAALVASGAHSHHGAAASDRDCVACSIAHAPMSSPEVASAPPAPEPTHERVLELPVLAVLAPSCALPSPRGPPLA